MVDPIQNIENIDILGERNDGGIDLCIVVSGYLDDTINHQNLLRSKIQAYSDAIFTDEWESKYGAGNSRIIIKAVEYPHPDTMDLIYALRDYLKEFNLELCFEIA